MDVVNQKEAVPFTTADGSSIRELLAHRILQLKVTPAEAHCPGLPQLHRITML